MNGMWFLLGAVCGVAMGACLWKRKRTAGGEASDRTVRTPTKSWGETRNFLYYDGTVMPEIKEDLNE